MLVIWTLLILPFRRPCARKLPPCPSTKKQLRSHGEVVSILVGAKDSKQYSTSGQSALLPKWNLTVDDRDCARLAVSAEVLSTLAGDKGQHYYRRTYLLEQGQGIGVES